MSCKDYGHDKEHSIQPIQRYVKKKLNNTVSNLKSLRRSISKLANQFLHGKPKKKDDSSDYFEDIPPEILSYIMQYLDYRDLCNCAKVSKKWKDISEKNSIWRKAYNDYFLTDYKDNNPKKSWKEIFSDSINCLKASDNLVANKPNECESYVSRALCHADLGHYKSSLRDINYAIHLKNQRKSYKNRDVTIGSLIIKRASIYRKLENYEQAYEDINESIRLEPNNSSYYRIRGNWYREDGKFELALKDINMAIRIEPDVSIYHFCKGIVLKELKNYSEALNSLNRAIELDKTNPEFYCTRGRIHFYNHDFESALKDFDKSVEIDPKHSDYFHWRGRTKRELNEYKEAMIDFEAALLISGDDIDYAWRGIMHSHMKNNELSLADITKAIQLAPNNSFHYQFRGIIYFGLERYKESLNDFTKAIELLPDWSSHYIWRSAIHYEQGNKNRSMKDLNKAISLSIDEVSLFWRGLAYLDRGEIEKGINDLEEAIKISKPPVHARIYFWRGVASYLTKNYDEAVKYFDEAVSLAHHDKKIAKYSEPARVLIITKQDEFGAKKLYRRLFDSYCTVDNAKTEQSHIELLGKLFPDNKVIRNIIKWFDRLRRKKFFRFPDKTPHHNTVNVKSIPDETKVDL